MNLRSTRLAGAALAAGATLVLASCGGSDAASSSASASTSTGPFTFDDARGETVEIDSTPTTVVAQSSVAAALWDAGYQVKGAYGELTPGADGELSYQAGNLDLDSVDVIGQTYGEFDTEEYALMNPDLLIDFSYDDSTLWYVPQAQAEEVEGLAPTLAVPGTYSDTDTAIETFVDLAGALGADTDSAELTQAKSDYEAALAAVGSVAESSGLTVAIMSPSKDSLYVAKPEALAEGTTLENQGLDLVEPTGSSEETDVFAQQSWEEATDYKDVDVILVDARTYDAYKADLEKIKTWTSLPAVEAGQVYPWYAAAPYSYASYASVFAELADDLGAAKAL